MSTHVKWTRFDFNQTIEIVLPEKTSRRTSKSSSAIVKREHNSVPSEQNPEPTTEEWRAFEEAIQDSSEKADVEAGVPSEQLVVAGTENDDTGINRELEASFIVAKEWRDKEQALFAKINPLMVQYAPLGDIEQELGWAIDGTSGEENRQLHERLQQVQSEKERLSDLMAPYGKEREHNMQELERYLQANLRMTVRQFFDTYGEAFDAWRQT